MTTNIRRRRRPVGGTSIDAFAPLGVSGLVAWYDFSDASLLFTDAGTTPVSADGDAIYQANDKSGNGYHISQAAAGNRPLYKVATKGGRSTALFDANDVLASTAAGIGALVSGSDKAYAVFAVAKTPASAANNDLVTWALVAGGSAFISPLEVEVTTSLARVMKRDTAGLNLSVASTTTLSASTWYQFSTLHTGTAVSLYVNGATTTLAGTAQDVGVTTTDRFSVGAYDTTTDPWLSNIAEVVVYNTPPAAANHNLIGNYLAYKYGLTWTTVA